MALHTVLIDPLNGQSLDCRPGFAGQSILVAESLVRLNSVWRSGINDAAETIDVVTPALNESILIVDLIITSSKKVAGSTIILQFHDGTNTEKIMEIEGASAPVEFSHSFAGGLIGWKDAILQVITDQAAMYVVTLVGYVKIFESLTKTYDEWKNSR